jgi:hypothetical protein
MKNAITICVEKRRDNGGVLLVVTQDRTEASAVSHDGGFHGYAIAWDKNRISSPATFMAARRCS